MIVGSRVFDQDTLVGISALPIDADSDYDDPMMSQAHPSTSPHAESWVFGANNPDLGLPLQHLPYCVFQSIDSNQPHLGVGIGACILDLFVCAETGLFDHIPADIVTACSFPALNPLMDLGPKAWATLRAEIQALLSTSTPLSSDRRLRTEAALVTAREAIFSAPVFIPNYTDFYSSIDHAERVGMLFRPDQPLLPNYQHVPIGYHGRTSSIVLSGTSIQRPKGQSKPVRSEAQPGFAPTTSLDYELELGLYIGQSNPLGTPIPIERASSHLFGISLLNDWSARDIQSWEYQPLGPFLGKNFATSISPWITPISALGPFRSPAAPRLHHLAESLPYLLCRSDQHAGNLNLILEVFLVSLEMKKKSIAPVRLSRVCARDLYWTPAQLIAHHTSNGCNLQVGDLLATGTISGPDHASAGCLLELTSNGTQPITLPTGESRAFLVDGDEVILRGYGEASGHPRIILGECRGTIHSG